MKRLNVDFFDEFKELDNLCIDLLGEEDGKRGVSLYIEKMSNNARRGEAKVEGWDSDYKNLKDVRHARNRLAHSQGSFSDKMCTKDQLAFVRSFKTRIQNGTDPLSLLHKRPEKAKPRRRFSKFLIFLLIILVILFVVKLFILK